MKKIIVSRKDCAEKVNEIITEWARHHNKIIVAIDGYTGAGKTTLVQNLARINPSLLPVNRDDFVIARRKVRKLFLSTNDRARMFERDICDFSKLKELITVFKRNARSCTMNTYNPISGRIDIKKMFDTRKQIMVIEGVFMFHPELINHLWDKRIYLDGKIDVIDRRRVLREKKKWGAEYVPETHPDSFLRSITGALKDYREKYHPDKGADIVIYQKDVVY